MDVLDRYLAQVQRSLPAAKRADISEEISDELQSQFEEREASLGRPLTNEEAADIIRAFGSPRAVALRYAPQRYLIGPELLPSYFNTLKVLILIAGGVLVFEAATRAVALHDTAVFWNEMGARWESLVWIVGGVTIVFALLQHFGKRPPQRWDPLTLPPVDKGVAVSRNTVVFELIFNVALALVMLTVVSQWEGIHSRVWQPIYEAIIASSVINAIALGITLARPAWGRVRLAGQLVANAVNIAGLVFALRAVGPDEILLRPFLAIFLVPVGIAAVIALWKLLRRPAIRTTSPGAA